MQLHRQAGWVAADQQHCVPWDRSGVRAQAQAGLVAVGEDVRCPKWGHGLNPPELLRIPQREAIGAVGRTAGVGDLPRGLQVMLTQSHGPGAGVVRRACLLKSRRSSAETPRLDGLPQIASFCDMPTMTMRVDRRNMKAAKKILAGMGLTPRAAIDVFLARVVSQKAIPFPLAMPDSEYAKAEYGMTPAELAVFDRRMDRAVAAEMKAGTIRSVTGIASLRE